MRRAWLSAAEEAGHARVCFAFAARHLGHEVHPEALPPVAPRALSLRQLALECWNDGCNGEAAAARFLERRAGHARSPEVSNALRSIARDEQRHAELGWSTLIWCLAQGGEEVRDALASARPVTAPEWCPSSSRTALAEHGMLPLSEWHGCVRKTSHVARERLRRWLS